MKRPTLINRQGILAGGNWGVDHIKQIAAYPPPERTATISRVQQSPGGSSFNVLADLARLGADFPLWGAGLLGKDEWGDRIMQECDRLKIDPHYLRATTAANTPFTDVMTEQGTGRRTFFHYRGANALWAGEDLDFQKIKARIFHLGYLLSLDALDALDRKFGTKGAALLATAQAAGLKTSIDVISEESDRYMQIVRPALKYTDYCILNEFEAGKIAGFKIRRPNGELDNVALRHTAGALLQLGIRELVIIHFPQGAFARTRKGDDCWQPSVKLPGKCLIDTTGAGDAFCAGALWALHENADLAQCLQTGVCTAAACLTDLTATGGIKPLNDVLDLARKYRFGPSLEPQD
jgi:sugar/nucleoside kinase (ribokinase family)